MHIPYIYEILKWIINWFTNTYGPIRIRVIARLDKADHVETAM